MKKILLVAILLLSMLVLTMTPAAKTVANPKSLPFNVTPVKEEFAEAANEATGDIVEDPIPWWVDMVTPKALTVAKIST